MPSDVTLLTPEMQEKICDLIRKGNRNEVAAEACGVTVATYYRWKRDNEEFSNACYAARAHAEVEQVAAHLKGDPFKGNNTSTAAFNWLKTSRAKHYAEETRVSVEIQTQLDGFLNLLEQMSTPEFYVRFLTAWQSEGDGRSARERALTKAQGNAGAKLLGTTDVVDTEGEPAL
ncbi:MAG: hypothetical protein KAJ55_02310 [Anaerolineales bacterium]|nr:hypothetical protein [Anaerolineales bacterium]